MSRILLALTTSVVMLTSAHAATFCKVTYRQFDGYKEIRFEPILILRTKEFVRKCNLWSNPSRSCWTFNRSLKTLRDGHQSYSHKQGDWIDDLHFTIDGDGSHYLSQRYMSDEDPNRALVKTWLTACENMHDDAHDVSYVEELMELKRQQIIDTAIEIAKTPAPLAE